MTDDLVKRLRYQQEWGSVAAGEAADRIEELQDIIARIQNTNMRRDINMATRMTEIDRMCKQARKDK